MRLSKANILFAAFGVTALSYIALRVPFLFFIVGLVWAAPVAVIIRQYNLWVGLMALGLGAAPLVAVFGINQAAFLLTQLVPLTVFIGLALKNHLAPGRSILTGFIVALLSTVMGFYFLFQWDLAMVFREFQKEAHTAIEAYKAMGYFDGLLEKGLTEQALVESMDVFLLNAFRLIPAVMILWSLMLALINYLVVNRILIRLNHKTPEMPAFKTWRLPWHIIWGLIIGLACLIFGGEGQGIILSIIGGNLLLIYFYVLVVLGVSVFAFFFEILPFSFFLKVLMIITIVLTLPQVSFMLFAITGLIDLLYDIRAAYETRVKGES